MHAGTGEDFGTFGAPVVDADGLSNHITRRSTPRTRVEESVEVAMHNSNKRLSNDLLEHDVAKWRSRAVVSWLLLALVGFVTCANYSSADDIVARRQLTVGEKGATVHMQDGVLTITGKDGSKAQLATHGLYFTDPEGKAKTQFSASK